MSIKQNNSSLMSEMAKRISLLCAMVFFAVLGTMGQKDTGARRVTLGNGNPTHIIAYSETSNNLYLDPRKEEPQEKDLRYCLLIAGSWMPTTKYSEGNVHYDNVVLPLNDQKLDNQLIVNYANGNRDSLQYHKPIDFKLDLIVTPYYHRQDTSWLRFSDTVYLCVENKGEDAVSCQWVLRDTILMREKLFDSKHLKNDTILFRMADIQNLFGIVIDANCLGKSEIDIPCVRMVPDGHVSSYYRKANLIWRTEYVGEIPTTPDPEPQYTWIWIVGGALLLLLCLFLAFKKKIQLLFEQRKGSKKFEFDFDQIAGDVKKEEEKIEELRKKATDSMSFSVKKGHKFSFYVNRENVDSFVRESRNGVQEETDFYQILVKYINGLKQKEKKVKKAQKTLSEIDTFVARIKEEQNPQQKPQQKQKQKDPQSPPLFSFETGQVDAMNEEELKQEVIKYRSAIVDIANAINGTGIGRIDQPELEDVVKTVKDSFSDLKTAETSIQQWTEATSCQTPDQAKSKISQLDNKIESLQSKIDTLETEQERLNEIVEKVQKHPKKFEDLKEFDELSKLIKEARRVNDLEQEFEKDPDKIKSDSTTGELISKGRVLDACLGDPKKILEIKLDDKDLAKKVMGSKLALQVKKGLFLDQAKDDVKLITSDSDGWLKGSQLWAYVDYVSHPEEILKSKQTNTELYKLLNDLDGKVSREASQGKALKVNDLSSDWLKERMDRVIEQYNHYLTVKKVAEQYGKPDYDTSALETKVKTVFDNAKRYLDFDSYKNYWKNVINPLFQLLNELYKHKDPAYNTRALLFYASQFCSIACVFNEIYGYKNYPTSVPKVNVGLFNSKSMPSLSQYGFPVFDKDTLNRFRYQYVGFEGEDSMVDFFKDYKPMPFIFINSYFADDMLSK